MIHEYDPVVLTRDVPEYGLEAGDVGTVVMIHRGGEGYEVEFTTLKGETVGVLTLMAGDVRPVDQGEVAHVRKVA